MDVSPDDVSQRTASAALSRAAGGFGNVPAYDYDRMNSIVYPVHGGMEDWAYAGSWDAALRVEGGCAPTTFYSSTRTENYANASLRAFPILVETSDLKSGPASAFGNDDGTLFDGGHSKNDNDGHVSRNVRLAIAAIDLLEPYVYWSADSTPPLKTRFFVGGAIDVTEARIRCGCGGHEPHQLKVDDSEFVVVPRASRADGTARWSPALAKDALRGEGGSFFEANLENYASTCAAGDASLWVIAEVRVDTAFLTAPPGSSPTDTPPQTHLANARANPKWLHQHNGHVVKGREWWSSEPIVLPILQFNPA